MPARRVRRDHALSAQRSREQQQEQAGIAGGDGEHGPDARGLRPAPPPQAESGERQHLDRVQADEMRDAKVAVLAAPARHRQARAAVGTADRVCSGDGHPSAGARPGELRRRRARHHRTDQGAGDRQDHAEAQRPAERAIDEVMPPERDRNRDAHQRLPQDRGAHDEEERRVERRRDVEVAGRAAPGLEVDEHHFQHEHDRGGPADDAADARPVGQQAEDPREREAVDGDRDRELERLQPRRRAGDDPWIDDDADDRGRGRGEHQQADGGQRRAGPPQVSQERRGRAGPDDVRYGMHGPPLL